MRFSIQKIGSVHMMLCENFGEGNYEYEVFEGKGHLDCWTGREKVWDVYLRVGEHVDRVMGALYSEYG